ILTFYKFICNFKISLNHFYMSEETKQHCITKFNLLSIVKPEDSVENLRVLKQAKTINPASAICVGDITIRAYAVPHSAYGSIMLLIEADGKRVLHTGDFKRSGIGTNFMEQIKKLGDVDIVITEGTMLNRQQTLESESELCNELVEVMRKHKYVFVLTSSLNADRLASVTKAASECGKPLTVCSSMMQQAFKSYQKDYPEIFTIKPTFYPFNHGRNGDLFSNHKIRKFESWVAQCGFVQCVGIGQFERVRDMTASYNPEECALVYSIWNGYYLLPEQIKINPKYKEIRELFINVYDIHSSGHADKSTIAEMLMALNPGDGIIGIHKEAGESLTSLNIPEELKAKIIPDNYLPDYVAILS
ncbi:MAG: hypothetical protein NC301_08530, partial [Bacteroides sp.]|nr:hypothetical protein [Bacteroides sp.]MCM1380212.1 hypothetical protein [Bacteroides sp.]MCM1446529.1 hypothetical protein [Prevotella sp.]